MREHIQFGSRRIDFVLQYQERKSLSIKVYPELKVEVLAPHQADLSKIKSKVRLKAPWILKQIEFFNSFKPATKPRNYVSGETHLYLGRQYRLKVIPDSINEVKAYRGQLFVHAIKTDKNALEKQLRQWYKQRAEMVFADMMKEVLPRFRKFKIQEPGIAIRYMAKRWGSCTPNGKVILNTELIKAPKGCIEYVVAHELSHLVHHNHTKEFFDLQNRIMPDWKKWKAKLEYSLS